MLATMDKRKCKRKRGIYTYAHAYDQLAVTSLYEGPRALVTFTTERSHRAIHRDLIPTFQIQKFFRKITTYPGASLLHAWYPFFFLSVSFSGCGRREKKLPVSQ